MCCIVGVLAMISPRLAIFLIWLFDRARMSMAFDSFWIAFLGFLVLPWTTLAWAVCYAPARGVNGFGWFVVIFGFFLDISSYTGSARAQQQRSATV
ncbi:MAG TPA: hypothetical protein VIJ47_10855 [Acidimicrobiales bacterium]|jgi:hypothetical protein